MAASLARNLCSALPGWPIMSITTIWMHSLVALFWISNPGKPWEIFVSNRVKKIAEITEELKIVWKYCPTKMNLADLGSMGMSIEKMESLEWFTGPKWLLDETTATRAENDQRYAQPIQSHRTGPIQQRAWSRRVGWSPKSKFLLAHLRDNSLDAAIREQLSYQKQDKAKNRSNQHWWDPQR